MKLSGGGTERVSPLLRAQFYHDEAEKLREHAATEEKEPRRKLLLELAESYEETAKMLVEQAKGLRRKS
jgi:hypothetical protein